MESTVDLEAIPPVPVAALLNEPAREIIKSGLEIYTRIDIETYSSASERWDKIMSKSPKKKPMRTRVRTMSIREPIPAVFSNAFFCASMAFSYEHHNTHISRTTRSTKA